MTASAKFSRHRNRNIFQHDYHEAVEVALAKIRGGTVTLEDLEEVVFHKGSVGTSELLSPVYFLQGLDELIAACDQRPEYLALLIRERRKFIDECLPQVKLIATACDNDTWELLADYREGKLTAAEVIESLEDYDYLLPNTFFQDFINRLKQQVNQPLRAALMEKYPGLMVIRNPYNGPYYSAPKYVAQEEGVTAKSVFKFMVRLAPTLLESSAKILAIAEAGNRIAVAAQAINHVPPQKPAERIPNAPLQEEMQRMTGAIRDQVGLHYAKPRDNNPIHNRAESFFDQNLILSAEQKTFLDTVKAIAASGHAYIQQHESLRHLLEIVHAADLPNGVSFEDLGERYLKGAAETPALPAAEKQLAVAKYFFARAIGEPSAPFQRVLKNLLLCVQQSMLEIHEAHMEDIYQRYQSSKLQDYELHYQQFQEHYSEYKNLETFLELTPENRELSQRVHDVARLFSPAVLRERGIAIPPIFDPKKTEIEVEKLLHMDAQSPTYPKEIFQITRSHFLPDPAFLAATPLPQALISETKAQFPRMEPLVQSEEPEAYVLSMFCVSLLIHQESLGSAEAMRLSDRWLQEAMTRGSVHAFALIIKSDFQERWKNDPSYPQIQDKLLYFAKRAAAAGYSIGSWQLHDYHSRFGDKKISEFFKVQALFQKTGLALPGKSLFERGLESSVVLGRILPAFINSPSLALRLFFTIGFLGYTLGLPVILLYLVAEGLASSLTIPLGTFFATPMIALGMYRFLNHPRRRTQQPIPVVDPGPSPEQIAAREREEKMLTAKLEFLNQLKVGCVWEFNTKKKRFCLSSVSVEGGKLSREKFLEIFRDVLNTMLKDCSIEIIAKQPTLTIPIASNQEEWDALAPMQQLLQEKLQLAQQVELQDEMLRVQKDLEVKISQTQKDREVALQKFAGVFSAEAQAERAKLWARIDGYQEMAVAVSGHGKIKQQLKEIQETRSVINELVKMATMQDKGLRVLEITELTLDEVCQTTKTLLENCMKISKKSKEIVEAFAALPIELTSDAGASKASTKKSKPDNAKNNAAFFSKKSSSVDPQKPKLAAEPPLKSSSDPEKSVTKVRVNPAIEAATATTESTVKPVLNRQKREPVLDDQGRLVLPPKLTKKIPLKPRKQPALPTQASISTTEVNNHRDHISSLLSPQNDHRDSIDLLVHGLYYHVLRILVALSKDDSDKFRQLYATELLSAFSHSYHQVLRRRDLLMPFCQSLKNPQNLAADALKSCELYQFCWQVSGGFPVDYLKQGNEDYLADLQREFSLLVQCRKIFLDQDKQPKFATHFHSAAKGILTIIGEAGSRLRDSSAAYRASVEDWQTTALCKSIRYLQVCTEKRNLSKHIFDDESAEIYLEQEEPLTVEVEEFSTDLAIRLAISTCTNVDLRVYARFIEAVTSWQEAQLQAEAKIGRDERVKCSPS